MPTTLPPPPIRTRSSIPAPLIARRRRRRQQFPVSLFILAKLMKYLLHRYVTLLLIYDFVL
jgi:hypothetical protein